MIFYPSAIFMFVPDQKVFKGANPGARNPSIVIHKTAGFSTIEQLGNFFGSLTETDASSHYGVGLDGRVAQFVSEGDGAGGNCCLESGHDTFWDSYQATYGNLNLCTFSIEHIDPTTDNSTTPTQAQLDASFALVLYLCKKYNITSDRIKPHSSLDPISRARCPGKYPMSSLIQYIQENTMGVPIGWSDDGTSLHNPENTHVVTGGFRTYILNHPWLQSNVPLENEYAKNPVEEFYPSMAGTWQTFRYSALAWTSQRNVYVPGIGNEFIGLEKARASLEQRLQNPPTGSVADIEQELSLLEDNILVIRGKLGVSGP